jgi:hypothetical protein
MMPHRRYKPSVLATSSLITKSMNGVIVIDVTKEYYKVSSTREFKGKEKLKGLESSVVVSGCHW